MSDFWNSLKLTVAEIGGKILGVLITLGTLAATIWVLIGKLRGAKQEAEQAKAQKELDVTMANLANSKESADDLEKKYRDALAKYKSESGGSSGGTSVP